jgi:hypothetical protein
MSAYPAVESSPRPPHDGLNFVPILLDLTGVAHMCHVELLFALFLPELAPDFS